MTFFGKPYDPISRAIRLCRERIPAAKIIGPHEVVNCQPEGVHGETHVLGRVRGQGDAVRGVHGGAGRGIDLPLSHAYHRYIYCSDTEWWTGDEGGHRNRQSRPARRR